MKRLIIGGCLILLSLSGYANKDLPFPNTDQTITFFPLANRTYGDADFDPGATASSGLTVIYSSGNTAIATISSGKIHIVSAGTVTIYADQPGDATFNPAPQVSQSLTIDPKTLTITGTFTVNNRVYNATSAATIASNSLSLIGIVSGDVVTLTAVAAFADKNVGNGKTIGLTDSWIGGTDFAKYILSFAGAPTTTANITKANLSVTGSTSIPKVYDTFISAPLGGTPTVTPLLSDVVNLGGTAAGVFTNKNVGNGKAITITGVTISGGADAGNYTLVQQTGLTGNITPAIVTVTAFSDTRTYTATTASVVIPSVSGIISPDVITSGPTQSFDNKNVGTSKTLTPCCLVINDGNSGNNYSINYVPNATGVINKATVTVTALTDNRIYNATTSSSAAPNVSGIISPDVVGTAPTQTFDNKNVGTGKTMTAVGLVISDGNSGNNYNINYVTNSTGAITKATVTVTAQTDNRIYNGTISSSVSPTVAGILAPDVVGTAPTQTFDTRHVGTGKTMTAIGLVINDGNSGNNYNINYVTNTTGVITKATVTVTAQADTKVYDGTTSSSASPNVSGILSPDVVGTSPTQTYNTKHVGTGKTMTAAGLVISDGNSGGNYNISYVTNTSGVITVKPITVTAGADTKIYNATTSSSVTPGISPSLATGDTPSFIQTFDTKHVGTGKTLTPSGTVNDGNSGNNYSVSFVTNATGVINKATVTVTALTDNRIYNATTSSSVAPNVSGIISPDVVGTTPTQTFDNKNVGTGKTMTAVGLVISDGNSGNNYNINYVTNSTGAITKATVTVTAQTDNRIYNGTISSSVSPNVAGILAPDVVGTAPTQTFDTRHVGTGKTMTAIGLVINDGNSGNNYNINYVTNTTGVITKATVTVTAQADTKVYDGTTSSSASPNVSGILSPDVVGTSPTQTYNTKHVGTGKTMTAAGLVISDGNSGGNYNISYVTNTSGVITVKPITVTAGADTKIYNATTSSSVTPGISPSLATGDTPSFIQTFDTKHVGTGKTLTPSGTVNDGNSGNNYSVSFVTNATGVINKATVTVTALTDNRIYNATTSSSVAPNVSGIISPDVVGTAPTQTFDNKNVGTGKTMTAVGLVISDGNSGNNYNINYVTNSTGAITKATVTVTAQTDNRIYNGTISSSVSPNVAGILAPDVVGTAPTQTFDTRHVGTGKTMTAIGLVINDGNSGNNYNINYVTNTTGVITKATVTVTAQADTKVYDGTTSSSASPNVSGILSPDVVGTSPTQTYNTKHVGTGKTMTAAGLVISDGNSGGNYTISYVTNTAGVITAKPITVTAQTDSKLYDANVSSSVIPTISTSLISGDTPSFIQKFNTKNAGPGKTLIPSGSVNDGNSGNNYAVTFVNNTSGVITSKPLTIGGSFTAKNKYYDGTTADTIATNNLTLITVISGDVVALNAVATFVDKSVGTGKTVNLLTSTLTGADALNYYIDFTGAPTSAADIIRRDPVYIKGTFTVTSTKVYDGTTSVAAITSSSLSLDSVKPGDIVNLVPAAKYSDKNAGTSKIVTLEGSSLSGSDAANYFIDYTGSPTTTADITQRPLTVTATGKNKIYDGSMIDTVLYSDNRISGDIFTVSGNALFSPDKTVGTGKTINVTGITLSGTDAGNYSYNTTASATADITKRPLIITASGNNKVYDGTTTGTVNLYDNRVPGDVMTTSYTSALFANANVGTVKTVNVSGINVTGTDAANYSYNTTASTTASVTGKPLTLTATGPTKEYGTALTAGSSAANFTPTATGVGSETITSVTLTPDAAGLSATTSAGSSYTVTPSNPVGSGGFLASNYTITPVAYPGTVAKAPLTITPYGNKKYGSALTSGSGKTTFNNNGLKNGETIGSITITYNTGSAVTAAVGTYTGQAIGSSATGGTFTTSNYSISYNPGDITITQASLIITAHNVNKLNGATLAGYSGSTAFKADSIKNSETVGTVTITYGAGSASTDAAGTYTNSVTPSAATGGTFTSGNYSITYTKGRIYVQPKTTINTQPSSSHGCEYSEAVFSVISSGINLNYLWKYRENSSSSAKNITNPPFIKHSGENTNALTLDSILGAFTGYQFSCIIRSSFWEDSLATTKVLRGDTTYTNYTTLTIDKSPPPYSIIKKKGSNILICWNTDTVTYKWGDAAGAFSNQTSQSYNASGTADLAKIWVTTTNKNGCSTTVLYGQTGTIGLVDPWISPFPLTVAPNPNNGTFTIKVTGLAANTTFQVIVLDYKGTPYPNSVKTQITGTELTIQNTDINKGAKLSPGIYFIDVIQGTKRAVGKIIVNSN